MNEIAIKELEEIEAYIQEMRESGDTDLRQIIHVIKLKIKELKES